MRAKGIVYTALAACIFGFVPVFAGLSYDMGNNPNNMALFRNLMVLPFLVLIVREKRLSIRLTKKELTHMGIVGVLGSGLTTIFLYQSYTYVGVGTATTIHFFYPLLVCLYCRVFFQERIRKSRLVCLAVCTAGVLAFLDAGDLGNMRGVALAFGSAVTYAFYMTFLEKTGLARLHPAVFALYLALIVSAMMLLLNIRMNFLTVRLPVSAYGAMFVVAIGTSLVGSILLNRGVALIGAAEAAIFSLFEPITSIIAGIAILGEPFGARNAAGCLLIFGAIVGMMVWEARHPYDSNPYDSGDLTLQK